jgi:IS4 transposase
LAIELGFCRRTSKLSPEIFFDLLFYATSLHQNSSLEYLVSYLESKYGIVMRKQSLDDRFTDRSVNFVKRVLAELIRAQFSDMLYSEQFLSAFRYVRIKDSTKFNIPNNLAAYFKGSGGSGSTSEAGISIQYEFDLKTGRFLDLTITEAIRNDQTDATETAKNVDKDDLVIRDLGYFSTGVLKMFMEKGAYFLSRLHSSVLVYDENGKEIDFKKCFVSMKKHGIEKLEMQVFIGKDKVPVRLYIGLVPPEVYAERMRRKKSEEKRKGRKMKERTSLLLGFNLFVTNVEEEKLPMEKIMPLYRFRWQVELMYKNWKSLFAIHALQKMKVERYLTMLYIRLILIIVNLQIINKVQSLLYGPEINASVLSYKKALQTLKNSFAELMIILRDKKKKAMEFLADFYLTLSKNHWREKRKKRENFIENISLFSCISDE